MQRLSAILCALATIGMASAQAQVGQRGGVTSPYGAVYGGSPYNSGVTSNGTTQSPYGSQANPSGTSFTSPNPVGTDNTAAPTPNSGSGDYNRVMNDVNSSTGDTDSATPANQPQTVATPPSNNSGGYANPMGSGVTMPTVGGGPVGSNGTFSTTGGTTGLGAYNRSPYAGGGTTTANPAPGPGTPVYTGTGQ